MDIYKPSYIYKEQARQTKHDRENSSSTCDHDYQVPPLSIAVAPMPTFSISLAISRICFHRYPLGMREHLNQPSRELTEAIEHWLITRVCAGVNK